MVDMSQGSSQQSASPTPERADPNKPPRQGDAHSMLSGATAPRIAGEWAENFCSLQHLSRITNPSHPKNFELSSGNLPGHPTQAVNIALVGFGESAFLLGDKIILSLDERTPERQGASEFEGIVYQGLGGSFTEGKLTKKGIYQDLSAFGATHDGVLCLITPHDRPDLHDVALRASRQWCRGQEFDQVKPALSTAGTQLTDDQLMPLVISYGAAAQGVTEKGFLFNDTILPVSIGILNLSGQNVLINGRVLEPLNESTNRGEVAELLKRTFEQPDMREKLDRIVSDNSPLIVLEPAILLEDGGMFASLVRKVCDPKMPELDSNIHPIKPVPLTEGIELMGHEVVNWGTHKVVSITQA